MPKKRSTIPIIAIILAILFSPINVYAEEYYEYNVYSNDYEAEAELTEPEYHEEAIVDEVIVEDVEEPEYTKTEPEPTYETITPLSTVSVNTWAELASAIGDASIGIPLTIYLENDINEPGSGTIAIPDGRIIRLTSANNGVSTFTNTLGRHFYVSGTLELANIILSGDLNVANNHGGIDVHNGGLLIMHEGSVITNGRTDGNGAGVHVQHYGSFIMEGGSITRNIITGFLHRGGGVEVDGNFIMRNGLISENEADLGGGVSVAEGLFTMEGGTISQNIGTWGGGGVAMLVEPSFIMEDGVISQNTAAVGADVLVANGIFTMINGSIQNNTADIYNLSPLGLTGTFGGMGGGIFVTNLFYELWLFGFRVDSDETIPTFDVEGLNIGDFVMQGGAITGNTARAYGGGVYVMGEIAIDFSGEQIKIDTPRSFTMQNGNIANNHAQIDGGGIFTEVYEYEEELSPGAYGNLTIGQAVTFSSNTAGGGSFLPPLNPQITNINTTSSSIAGQHALNNFDINFRGEVNPPQNEQPQPQPSQQPNETTPPNQPPPTTASVPRRPQTINRIDNARRPSIPNRPPSIIEPLPTPPDLTLFRDWFIFGYPDGYVRPNNVITRAEMVQIFYNLSPDPTKATNSGHSRFSDIDSSMWFFNAFAYLERRNLIAGFPDGTARPNQPITNAEFVSLAVRYFGIQEILTDSGLIPAGEHWAAMFINLGLNQDWLDYFEVTHFNPDAPITRVQSVALLNYYQGRNPNPEVIHAFLQGRVIFPDIQPGHWMFYEMIEAAIARYYRFDEAGNELWINSPNIARFSLQNYP